MDSRADRFDLHVPRFQGCLIDGSRPTESNRAAWDRQARAYELALAIETFDIHYGPNGPGERELNLLGEIDGLSVLDLGCGGGHNSVALASRGAVVTGIDFSEAQLSLARARASQHGLEIAFVNSSIEQYLEDNRRSFDVIFSCFALEYIPDQGLIIGLAARALRAGGSLVLCDLHPLVSSADLVGVTRQSFIATVDYFRRGARAFTWELSGSTETLTRFHATVGDYVHWLTDAGLVIERFCEPAVELRSNPTYDDPTIRDQSDVWSALPYSFALRARAPT